MEIDTKPPLPMTTHTWIKGSEQTSHVSVKRTLTSVCLSTPLNFHMFMPNMKTQTRFWQLINLQGD